MKTNKTAIGYIRVSSAEQTEDSQKSAILEYANANGYEIEEWRIDNVSGVKDSRPAIEDILYGDAIPASTMIVFKNDRLARDTKLYFYYLYLLERKGIKLISVTEDFDIDGAEANLYRTMLMFVAEQERKNIIERTSAARKIKAGAGQYSGGRTPYGYRTVSGKLEIDETERPIIEYIFANLHNRPQEIADDLNDMGYKTRKGTRFHDAQVRSIISNRPLYEGMYKYGDMDWVKGVHEPILKEEEK